jgi:hypothetical protein
MKINSIVSKCVITAALVLASNAFARDFACDNKANHLTERLAEATGTATTTTEIVNFQLNDDNRNDTYGSRDPFLQGSELGRFVHFKLRGGANSEYSIALYSDFMDRRTFTMFLDSWYEGMGGGPYVRHLDCLWIN